MGRASYEDVRQRQAIRQRASAREFESFVGGAGGRLLRAATLLTGEDPLEAPRALRLVTAALAATFADWDRLRGEDPYDRARGEIAARFARTHWLGRRGRAGVLAPLTGRERLVLVLRLCEGVGDEQTAALLGLPVERVRGISARAVRTMLRASGPHRRRADGEGVPERAGSGARGSGGAAPVRPGTAPTGDAGP